MRQKLSIAATLLVLLVSRPAFDAWQKPGHDPKALEEAAARLNKAPMTVGQWQGEVLPALDPDAIAQAQLSGYIWRRYRDSRSGDAVSVLLVCGRPGQVSVHTPDVCYTSAGYDMLDSPISFVINGTQPAEVCTARFHRSASPEPADICIYWSWNGTGSWESPSNPRVAFAGEPALYKVYVICDAPLPGASSTNDGCEEFLASFLPALQQALSPRAASDGP